MHPIAHQRSPFHFLFLSLLVSTLLFAFSTQLVDSAEFVNPPDADELEEIRSFLPSIVPVDGQEITESCSFKTDHYKFSHGLRIVNQQNLIIDLKNSIIEGNFTLSFPHGVSSGILIEQSKNITITGYGFIKDFYYGIVIRDSVQVQVHDINLNRNWRSNTNLWRKDEFQINKNLRAQDYGRDFTSLGGGVFMLRSNYSQVSASNLQQQNSGINIFSSSHNRFYRNFVGKNSAFGIQLRDTEDSSFHKNDASNCNSLKFEDTAGIFAIDSHNNEFIANQVHKCGRGIAQVRSQDSMPFLNGNLIESNVAFSNLVAYDGDGCRDTMYRDNIAAFSKLDGFQLKNIESFTLKANDINNNARFGIYIFGSHAGLMDSNNVSRNQETALYVQNSIQVNASSNSFVENWSGTVRLDRLSGGLFYNNIFKSSKEHISMTNCDTVRYNVDKQEGHTNIVGGKTISGNYWDTYHGEDTTGDGIGNTGEIPFTNGGKITQGGDYGPLVLPKQDDSD